MVQLVVDSGCDLPDEFLRKFSISVLPHSVTVGKDAFGDQRNRAQMSHFYSLSLMDRSRHISTGPASTEEIEKNLRGLLEKDRREMVVQTINGNNSPTIDNAREAVRNLSGKVGEKAERMEIYTVDSHTVFAGQGLLAIYTQALIEKGLPAAEVAARAEEFTQCIDGYAAVRDVYYLRERARSKNENHISWLKATLARRLDLHPILHMHRDGSDVRDTLRGFDSCTEGMFELAAEHIREGKLRVPMMVVSIAGRLEDLASAKGFAELEAVARAHKVKIYKAVMSLSGGINLGPGTIALALAIKG